MHRARSRQTATSVRVGPQGCYASTRSSRFRGDGRRMGFRWPNCVQAGERQRQRGSDFGRVRGLAIRDADLPRDEALQTAVDDVSPSVAIAACDGLLKSTDRAVRSRGHQPIDRACQRGKGWTFRGDRCHERARHECRTRMRRRSRSLAQLPRKVRTSRRHASANTSES